MKMLFANLCVSSQTSAQKQNLTPRFTTDFPYKSILLPIPRTKTLQNNYICIIVNKRVVSLELKDLTTKSTKSFTKSTK